MGVDEAIMQVLGEAAANVDFACHGAPERLLDLALWSVPATGAVCTEVPTPAPAPSFRAVCPGCLF